MRDEERFLAAFEEYGDALLRHCFFRISDRERAKDIVQDAFLKTWDYLKKGNQVDEFRPFLYRTLNNLIIDEYRRRSSESLDALLESETVTEGSFADLVVDEREALEMAIDAQGLTDILKTMPEQYRDVVVMRYLDGMAPREIAELTGENVNLVSVRIHRGLEWLRKNTKHLS